MADLEKLREPTRIDTWLEERSLLADHIIALGRKRAPLRILEAGCGTGWGLDLQGTPYTLTGVDLDQHALDSRLNLVKDLDTAICGDLRSLDLPDATFDVIYNSYVLEHVEGAEKVLNNFVRWLSPGGILLLIIPNRDSVWGFVARSTPFWFHVFFRKHVLGDPHSGKPGYAPYPTHYDKVVSRQGVYAFCEKHGLHIAAEYSVGHGRGNKSWLVHASIVAVSWIIHIASLKSLSLKHADLIYVIQKS